jgi:hypothetical protein
LHVNKDIILCEENKIINNQNEVAENFNNLFINVAKDIGSQDIIIDESHPDTSDSDSFKNFEEIPSFPLVFFISSG